MTRQVTWTSCCNSLGVVGESFSEKSFKDWVDYWSLIFPPITKENIDAFKEKHIGSEEEKEDIAKAYEQYKGNMDRIMDAVMFADATEEDRYRAIIDELIESKRVVAYDAYVKEPPKKRANRLKRALKEAKEAEAYAKKQKREKENKDASEDSLILALRVNQEKRRNESESLLDKLTEKYCKPTKKVAKKKKSTK